MNGKLVRLPVRMLAAAFVLGAAGRLIAQTPTPSPTPAPPVSAEAREAQIAPKGLTALGAITGQMRQIGDWQGEFDRYSETIDKMFEQNGWTDEPNQFIRSVMHDVGRIPPWDLAARLDKLTERIGDRYQMTPQQRTEFHAKFSRAIGVMAFENAATIFKQTREFVGMRQRDEPFTPEYVARWTKESEALLAQMRASLEKISAEMTPSLSPEQRAIQERDMNAFRLREKRFDELRSRWAAGGWKPEDFGFKRQAPPPAAATPIPQQPAAPAAPPPYQPYDENTWERYVRIFITQNQLDEGQAFSALSILDELQLRAQDYRRRHAAEFALAASGRGSADPYAPIQRLFEELQRRLEPIPTTAQRRQAGAATTIAPQPFEPPDAPPE